MKRRSWFLLIGIFIVVAIGILNMGATTQQCIDYQCHTLGIPLYLKILDFFDRHYNYKELVKRITKDSGSDEEKVLKILAWTNSNIRRPPAGFPIVDDHVWHIIIRGYGAVDQASDVFAALCNYAGMEAVFFLVDKPDSGEKSTFSFVKIKSKWYIFDPYRGAYFKDESGRLIDIESVRQGRAWKEENCGGGTSFDYAQYFRNLPSLDTVGLSRSSTQSPFNRLRLQLERWLGKF